MKISPRFRLCSVSVAGLAVLALVGPLRGADSAAPKTHRLFMGSNLSVVSKDTALPVRGVVNNSFVVRAPGGDRVVDPQSREFRLKIDDTLKLTATVATIDDLQFERTYTPGNDPMRKFAETARTANYLEQSNDAATIALRNAEAGAGLMSANLNTAQATAAANPGAEGNGLMVSSAQNNLSGALTQLSSAQIASTQSLAMTGMEAISTVANSNRLSADFAAEAYDAVRISFKLSTPRPMTAPYAVIFMRFMESKERPDTATVWVYAERLPDIDERPRSINILRGGFPPGYHIDSYQVHLYEDTTEIATNVSRKLVALTTDEAFQFSVIQHITGHRNQTQPPEKAAFFWPTDLPSRVLPEHLDRPLYAQVDKTGRARALFEDENCQTPVAAPALAELASELRFFPALDKGKPVDGIAKFKLGARP